MGKSTLAKHIKLAIENNLNSKTQLNTNKIDKNVSQSLEKVFGVEVPNVSYSKVSYDRILGENLSEY